MPSWILNFTKGGAKVKKQMPQQARELLELGVWGIPPTAQTKEKLAPGDRVVAYVGAPDRVFVGQAVVKHGFHPWSAQEAAIYPPTGTFSAGIALTEAELWAKPLPLKPVWSKTQGAKTNQDAVWRAAVQRIADADFDLIVTAARERTAPVEPQPLSDAPTAPPRAEVPAAAKPSRDADAAPSAVGMEESDKLFEVAQALRKYLSDPKSQPLNETSTRYFFIDRILAGLGYASIEEIEHGAPVETGEYADYVLRAGGGRVVAVEAKRIGHAFTAKDAAQVIKYCSVLGVRWGMLTDGRYIRIYDAPVTGVTPADRLVLEIDLNDWADREDFDLRR